MVANRENLALILTSKQGKPLSEALGELDTGAPMPSCTPQRRAASMAKRFYRRARMQGCLRSRHRLASAAPQALELPHSMITREVGRRSPQVHRGAEARQSDAALGGCARSPR